MGNPGILTDGPGSGSGSAAGSPEAGADVSSAYTGTVYVYMIVRQISMPAMRYRSGFAGRFP